MSRHASRYASSKISKEDEEIYFALMDIQNAQMGRFEKIQDSNVRALCMERNPSLSSSYTTVHRAEQEHKRRVRGDGLLGKSKRARGITRHTEESKDLESIRRRIRQRGYTKEEVIQIFEIVNRWLPMRYDYILAKSEGHTASASNIFSRAKMHLNAEVALGTGQLRGELFDDEEDYQSGWKEGEVERIQRMSRVAGGGDEGSEEDEFTDDAKGLTLEQAKNLYIESKVMVDMSATCTKDCAKTKCLNDVFSLYGCNDHGLIHLCLADDSCIHQVDNRDKDMVCIFSGSAVDKMYGRPREFDYRRRNRLFCAATHLPGMENSRMAHSVLQQEFVQALSALSEGSSAQVQSTQEGNSIDSDVVEFVHIDDKEFNTAMVESAIRSGEGCVVTNLAAAILVEKFFIIKTVKPSDDPSASLDEVAREVASTTSTRGLLEAERGSFLDDRTPSSTPSVVGRFGQGKTPFTPGIASAAAEGAFLSPESRKEGVGPSVIPSEDFVITGDTFVTPDVLREISAEGEGSSSGRRSSPLGMSGGERKENALFSSTHKVMCTSPITRGSKRRCGSPAFHSPTRGGSPLWRSRHSSRIDQETKYEINPYRGVQKRLRTWEKVMRTGDHPSAIVTPFCGNLKSTETRNGNGITVPKTPIATPRQVKEQEAILQSQAGVVMNRRKRGRNALVRSTPDGASPSSDSPFSSCSTQITRGSRPGRSKKNEDLYTEGMYQVYLPNRKNGSNGVVKAFRGKEDPSYLTGPKDISTPSPLLRKVLTSGQRSPILMNALRRSESMGKLHEERRNEKGKRKAPSIEIHKDQYFLVKGEKTRNRNTNLRAMAMLNRCKKLQRLKEKRLAEETMPGEHEEASGVDEQGGKGASDTVLMGSIADMLIGKPSVSSIYRIVKSESSAVSNASGTNEEDRSSTGKMDDEEQSSDEYYPTLQSRVQKNILQSKRFGEDSALSMSGGEKHEESQRSSDPRIIDTNSKEFRGRMERFLLWIEEKTLVFSDDMEQYKNSIRAVMKDLIFSTEKRKSMQTAYRIVSLVGAKDIVKTQACQASRELKRRRRCAASKDEEDELAKYRKCLTLGSIDDVFGRQLVRHGINVIPNNEEKSRKYSNEIYYLWRLLMTSTYAASLKNPKAQFDHFVLGVLYLLSERDIVLCDVVVMKHDPWLKEALPRRKRLCDNYTSKLKKNEVARLIQKHTSLRMDLLTFSTPSRVYNTRIITRGCTRVKDLIFHFDQEVSSHKVMHEASLASAPSSFLSNIDGDIIKYYISRNSTVDFIQVGKTSGNIRRAARMYKRRKALFY